MRSRYRFLQKQISIFRCYRVIKIISIDLVTGLEISQDAGNVAVSIFRLHLRAHLDYG